MIAKRKAIYDSMAILLNGIFSEGQSMLAHWKLEQTLNRTIKLNSQGFIYHPYDP